MSCEHCRAAREALLNAKIAEAVKHVAKAFAQPFQKTVKQSKPTKGKE